MAKLTKEEWIARHAPKFPARALNDAVVEPCYCGAINCEGWQVKKLTARESSAFHNTLEV